MASQANLLCKEQYLQIVACLPQKGLPLFIFTRFSFVIIYSCTALKESKGTQSKHRRHTTRRNANSKREMALMIGRKTLNFKGFDLFALS